MYVSIGRVSESVVQQAAWTLGWIGLLTMLVGMAGFVAAIRSIPRPLEHLMADSQRVGAGDLAHRATVWGTGEVAEPALSFNQMVDDLQRSRDELVQAKEYTDSILRRMTNSLIVTDARGVISIMNPATEDLLGYSETELVGQPLEMVFVERAKPFGGRSWDDFLSQGAIRNVQTSYRSKHGKEIPVLLSGSVMRAGDGGIQGVVCVAQDITERRHLDRLKDGVISTVSHELRTPLTTVNAGISLVLDGLLGDITLEQRDFLRTVEQRTKPLTRLIETVLDVSAMESDKLQLERSEVDVSVLIQEVCEGYRQEAGGRKLLPCVVTVPQLRLDRKRLRRMFPASDEHADRLDAQERRQASLSSGIDIF